MNPASSPTSDRIIIDPVAIAGLRELNPDDGDEFLREITTIFFEDTPQRLAELDQNFAKGDIEAFTRAAHSIKGSSANLGAVGVRQAAERLEYQARTFGLGETAALTAQLKVEFADAQTALTALVHPASA